VADGCNGKHTIDPSDRKRAMESSKGATVKCKTCGKRLRLKPSSGESVKDEAKVQEAKLSSQARNDLPASAFVFPKERRYPIHDESHAKNALARSSGKPEEATVRAAVYRRYPGLKKKE
jgi:predicted AAA+ superfamily ATPase